MQKWLQTTIFLNVAVFSQLSAASALPSKTPSQELAETIPDTELVFFVPPTGWSAADPAALAAQFKYVKSMFIGKGLGTIPPSLNLSVEPYNGTLRQYLQIVRDKNKQAGYTWKDLGTIKTATGLASLSQVDVRKEYGEERHMHTILLYHEKIYILTAAAPKADFSKYYQDFFNSMRSLKVTSNAFDLVDAKQQVVLKNDIQKLLVQWKNSLLQKQKANPHLSPNELKQRTLDDPEFQTTVFQPFKDSIIKNFNYLGSDWHTLFMQQIDKQLQDTQI